MFTEGRENGHGKIYNAGWFRQSTGGIRYLKRQEEGI